MRPKTSSPSVSAIVGGVFAVILIIVVVVIFTIVRKRNQTSPDREKGGFRYRRELMKVFIKRRFRIDGGSSRLEKL